MNHNHYLLALFLAPSVLALRQHEAEPDVELSRDEHRRCTRACGCGDTAGFFAETAAARSRYVGCNSSKPAQQPDLILVGVTKGGTTSFQDAGMPYICGPGRELHYFDFLQRRPTREEVKKDYLWHWESRCRGALTFEKTPAYLFRGAAALRICEALPGQKLAVLLREPVARAYSHYWEEDKANQGSPEDFHEKVAMETEVVRRCGGMVLGRPEDDLPAGSRFRECCEALAPGWPGCGCEHVNRWDCVAPYSPKKFSTVRFSIYVHYLRTWFRYHRAEDLLVLFSEDFFADMPARMCEMHCHAGALRAQQRCSGEPSKDFREHHSNRDTSTRNHRPMLPETKALLDAFFAPYNEELFALLGRRAPWG